jgi:hypothetical protein
MSKLWIYTKKLQLRAGEEGWGIFACADREAVQRIDSRDDGGEELADDDEAIALAIKAGVPCDADGTIKQEWEYED